MGAAGTAAVAMEAWLVSMALATSVARAMALGLTTTMDAGSLARGGTITFFQELRVDHQDEEAAERGPRECPERLQELHRGVPTRPTPPKSSSKGPGAASAPRRVQPPREKTAFRMGENNSK